MMTEKESGRLVGAEFHPLWESTTDAYGRRRYVDPSARAFSRYSPRSDDMANRYRNTVTGSMQQHIPEVCLGGILADVRGSLHNGLSWPSTHDAN